MVRIAVILILSVAAITRSSDARAQETISDTAKEQVALKGEEAKLLAEIRSKVLQVFGRAVLVAEGPDAKILMGDFNGDGWQDLAVVVRCAPHKSAILNDPYANWTVESPRRIKPPELNHMTMNPLPHPPSRELIHEGDLLLAIIHGDSPAGWRDSKATQAFLLYNIVGKELSVRNRNKATSAAHRRTLPPLRGDVISEVFAEQTGFVYWLGGGYLWFHEGASAEP